MARTGHPVTQGGEAVSGLRLSDHHTSPTPKLAPETQVRSRRRGEVSSKGRIGDHLPKTSSSFSPTTFEYKARIVLLDVPLRVTELVVTPPGSRALRAPAATSHPWLGERCCP